MQRNGSHIQQVKRKLSAFLLTLVLALSLGVQAFHLLSHALESKTATHEQHAGLSGAELLNHCVVCAQIFHQGQSGVPAAAIGIFAPVIIAAGNFFTYIPDGASGVIFRHTNKGPPPSILISCI